MSDAQATDPNGRTTDGPRPGATLSAAFVSPGWPPDAFSNGIVPYVADVADEMRRVRNRVAILTQRLVGEAGSDDVVDIGARSTRRDLVGRINEELGRFLPGPVSGRSARVLIAACRELIAGRGLQVVEMEESFGWTLPVQRGLPIPVVSRLHGPWFLNGPLQGASEASPEFLERVRIEGRAIREARAITAASLDVLERTRRYYGLALPDARVIHPSTKMIPEADRWSGAAADPNTVLFVGRFDRHKGGDIVIDAFAELAKTHPEARLRFVGPDSGLTDDAGRAWQIEPYLAERLGDLATSGRVEWRGRLPWAEIIPLRRQAAAVVVASRYDNFPVTVLEAMALGCPLVAPRIGGIPEIVEDGANGLLFEAERPADLARQVGRLLDDRTLASRLGARAGVDVGRRHDPRVIAGQVAGFFREVIGGRKLAASGGLA